MTRGLSRALLACTVLLAGCAAQPGRLPTDMNWVQHSARIEGLSHWSANGKLALRTAKHAESASIAWRQLGPNTRLQLSGPMGLSATTIESDGSQVAIQRGEKRTVWDISSPEAIVRNTGWDLPLRALPHWLKGLPAPHIEVQAMELDPEGELIHSLKQDDWVIDYERYGQFEQFTLPTRLRIRRGSTSARLIIRDWQTLPG